MALSLKQFDSPRSSHTALLPSIRRSALETVAANVTVDVIRGGRSVINQHAADWLELCAEGPCNLPFFTPSWIFAWLESFAPDAKVVLVLAMRSGKLRGVLPFVEQRIGLPGLGLIRLVQPANVHSNRIDVIHGSDDRDEVITALWKTLQTQVKWDVIDYRDVPTDGGFWQLATISKEARYPIIDRQTLESPIIPLSPETDLATLGPTKQLRRSRRLLEQAGGYEYIRHDPVEMETVDQMLQLEAAGWKGENGTAILCDEEERAFYTSVMTKRTSSMTPVIHEIRFEGEPIAFNFGIEMGDRYVEPKGTYSEAHRNFGLGHLLLHETAMRLKDSGFTSFCLLGHIEPYKALWTSSTLTHHQFLIFRKSPVGHALRWSVETLIPLVKRWKTNTWRERIRSTWTNRFGAASAGSGQ